MAASTDLVTLEEVREHLMIKAAETGRDDLIGSLITAASDAIWRWAEREFIPRSANPATRDFRYEGGGRLSLAPYDLRSVTSVTIDVDGANPSSTTLTADDYRLWPIPAVDGVYSAIELRNLSPAASSSAHDYQPSRQVRIVGTWGWVDATASVPKDVKRACVFAVQHQLKFVNPRSVQHDEDADRDGRFALPMISKQLLAPYRRRHA